MDYYINPIWFYLMQLSDTLHVVFFVCAILFIGFTAILYCLGTDCNEEEVNKIISKCKKFGLAGIIFIILAILAPPERTCLQMMVASQVTKENVSSAKEEIYDIVDYIDEKLNKE